MALTRLPGGIWVPTLAGGFSSNIVSGNDSLLLDADEEEAQWLGRVVLAAGSGSKTFGTSGSALSWLPGASITFASGSTLRVGVKKSSTWDDATGPPGRATIGAAAFDVYDDLVGGTDTITSTTWRTDSMSAGTPFTVTHGDRLAVCFHLDSTSGSPSVKARGQLVLAGAVQNFPAATLVTSGPTYTAIGVFPNAVLTFDDATIGWLAGGVLFSASSSEAIGNTNIYGNVIRFPFDCGIDAIGFQATCGVGTTNFDVGLWSDPAGTPTAMTNGTVSVDPQNMATSAGRWTLIPLPAEVSLTKNTDYFAGIKQNSATGITVFHYDVAAAGHFQSDGMDSTTYAAKSTGGAAVAAQNSGLRRCMMFVRISSIDVSAGGGGGGQRVIGG